MINILLEILYKLYNNWSNINININDSISGCEIPPHLDIYARVEKELTLTPVAVNVKAAARNERLTIAIDLNDININDLISGIIYYKRQY